MGFRLLGYIRRHLTQLVEKFRGDGGLHECQYHGCTQLTRYRFCEEHHAIQGQFVEKYHLWDKFKDDPSMAKNDIAKTELILRDRYEFLFNIYGDPGHIQWKEFLITHVNEEDIEEILQHARIQNEGYNVEYWEEKLREKRNLNKH
ncbi:hypothetical protein M8J76_000664 [Diaphorina citri]|nr:hypothetical protein M8J75_016637 [Diaphorina citri]KAI5723058.1 hypothetical protein M8J76_000664 [Diaphorina citri]KAI5728966.1 hypothetical protein M8J77_023728 [Diaphorina citri]